MAFGASEEAAAVTAGTGAHDLDWLFVCVCVCVRARIFWGAETLEAGGRGDALDISVFRHRGRRAIAGNYGPGSTVGAPAKVTDDRKALGSARATVEAGGSALDRGEQGSSRSHLDAVPGASDHESNEPLLQKCFRGQQET